MAETESLKQYACRHFAERLPEMARNGELESCLDVQNSGNGWIMDGDPARASGTA
ncbi:hypothetical protein N5T42_29285 [Escherichia coli]|nr:hypothetical protein [Escherichia coli]MCW3403242.1 hypothetical protein [Escherichia coli]